jgi:hypothetical protein
MTTHTHTFRVELERVVALARKIAAESSAGSVVNARRLLTEGFEGIDYLTAMTLVSGELEASELIEKWERERRYIEEALF